MAPVGLEAHRGERVDQRGLPRRHAALIGRAPESVTGSSQGKSRMTFTPSGLSSAHHRRGLPQPHRPREARPHPDRTRRADVRATGRHPGGVRPAQHLPRKPEHPARNRDAAHGPHPGEHRRQHRRLTDPAMVRREGLDQDGRTADVSSAARRQGSDQPRAVCPRRVVAPDSPHQSPGVVIPSHHTAPTFRP